MSSGLIRAIFTVSRGLASSLSSALSRPEHLRYTGDLPVTRMTRAGSAAAVVRLDDGPLLCRTGAPADRRSGERGRNCSISSADYFAAPLPPSLASRLKGDAGAAPASSSSPSGSELTSSPHPRRLGSARFIATVGLGARGGAVNCHLGGGAERAEEASGPKSRSARGSPGSRGRPAGLLLKSRFEERSPCDSFAPVVSAPRPTRTAVGIAAGPSAVSPGGERAARHNELAGLLAKWRMATMAPRAGRA